MFCGLLENFGVKSDHTDPRAVFFLIKASALSSQLWRSINATARLGSEDLEWVPGPSMRVGGLSELLNLSLISCNFPPVQFPCL